MIKNTIKLKEKKSDNKTIYHLNDITLKYIALTQAQRLHQYLGLPGNYKALCSENIIFRNMKTRKADIIYMNDEGMVIDIEEETKRINPKTLKRISEYIIFIANNYSLNTYLAIICHEDPKKEYEYVVFEESIIVKAHYFYLSPEEIEEKYENIINKVEHNEELDEMEALDVAFISKFSPRDKIEKNITKLVYIYKDLIFPDEKLKGDVATILGGMVLKHVSSEKKQKKLLEMVSMIIYASDLEELVESEYGDRLKEKELELLEKEETIKTKDQELKTKDKKINTQEQELKTKDQELKTKDQELKTKDQELKTKDKKISNLEKLIGKLKNNSIINSPQYK